MSSTVTMLPMPSFEWRRESASRRMDCGNATCFRLRVLVLCLSCCLTPTLPCILTMPNTNDERLVFSLRDYSHML